MTRKSYPGGMVRGSTVPVFNAANRQYVAESNKRFVPADSKQHELGNLGHDVPDYCATCGSEFMAHTNGVSPR